MIHVDELREKLMEAHSYIDTACAVSAETGRVSITATPIAHATCNAAVKKALEVAAARMEARAAEIVWEPPYEERRNYWHMNAVKQECGSVADKIRSLIDELFPEEDRK